VDVNKNRIVKVTPNFVQTVLAGSGSAGFADGQGSAAKFNNPKGIAVDIMGNVYVADCDNNRIRKITPSGMVSTLAGSGTAGFADGRGVAAQFKAPGPLTIDNNGNLFVADVSNNRIRKIDASGNASTIAGNGSATLDFDKPVTAITTDKFNNVYFISATNFIRLKPYSTVGVAPYLGDKVTISPNPASTYLNVSLSSANQTYHILNTLGQSLQSGTLTEQLDIQSLLPGLYFLQTEGGRYRFVKE
jgi:DNA-binding beta-propeller fold protein YncE